MKKLLADNAECEIGSVVYYAYNHGQDKDYVLGVGYIEAITVREFWEKDKELYITGNNGEDVFAELCYSSKKSLIVSNLSRLLNWYEKQAIAIRKQLEEFN